MTKTTLLACFLSLSFFATLSAQNFDLYVSDGGNFNNPPWQILKFDENGENGEVFISDHVDWPQDILFLESENTVLISNLNTNRISKFNAATGAFMGEFATGISGPTRMKIGADGYLYVLQWSNNTKVKRYQLDGTFIDHFTQTNTSSAIGLDWDASGNFYVSSFNGKYVRKYSPTGEDLGNFISANLSGPTNIWFGENGDLFVLDWNAGNVKRFDSNGNYLGIFITGVPQAEGVDFFPNGDIILGAGAAKSVKQYSADGTFIKDVVAAGSLNLLLPNAVRLRSTTPNPAKEIFKDVTFLTPSVGVLFEIANPGLFATEKTLEVHSTSGMLVSKINFADSTSWDASNLASGIYFITSKMQDGKIARQKVVVQR